MELWIEQHNTTGEAVQRGICAAETFLRTTGIETEVIYGQVLMWAKGLSHNVGYVDLWDKAEELALAAAYPEGIQDALPVLIMCNRDRIRTR